MAGLACHVTLVVLVPARLRNALVGVRLAVDTKIARLTIAHVHAVPNGALEPS